MMLAGSAAAAHAVPLPPPRPIEATPARIAPREMFGPPAPPRAAAQPRMTPQPDEAAVARDGAVCDALLGSGKVVASREAPIVGANGCGISAPIRLSAILLRDGSSVALQPPAAIRCDFAERVADWVRDDLAPLLGRASRRLTGLGNADSYDCRGRNRVMGAKLSEHGTGNAIDIRQLSFAEGPAADITKVIAATALFAQVKLTACTRFMTVLGPGSDGYHEDNLHLDAAQRRGGAHFCRWRLP